MGAMRPAVSVLVPVYNVEKYLRQCLDSLVGQTLADIEIVCVNDGSTDGSPAILEEYARADRRVVVVNKANGGLPSARNAGLNVARGRYVGFVDGDDYVAPEMFQKLYEAAETNDADIVICGGHLFPGEEQAPKWLKDTLSPQNIVYKAGGTDALFKERGAKPFLWRDFVRRDLIERNAFRLDEEIVVGEDQAFQFKIFATAKRVAFIADKLYYYRWSRPDSIMNEVQYKDYGTRIMKHVKMLSSIIGSWQQQLRETQTAVRFFEWCVDFLYWDIVRVTAVDRIAIAKAFCTLLAQNGYHLYQKQYSWDTRNHFNYMLGLASAQEEQPSMTVVAVFGRCKNYLESFLRPLLSQSKKDIEILLYENGADDATIAVARDFMYKDPRICIRLGEWQPVCQKYNDAIQTAKGKYIAFLNPYDYIQDDRWLEQVYARFEEDQEIDAVGYSGDNAGKDSIEKCQCADYRQFVYRVEKIRAEKLRFEDYSLLTGSVFFTKYCLVSEYAYYIPKFQMRGEPLRRQSIYASEAKLVLRAFVWLLQKAKENDLPQLAGRVTDLLNSENYMRLLTDSTFGFYIDESSVTDPKEDFHTEVLSLLVQANQLAVCKGEDRAILRTLSSFIAKRHLFLEKI